MTLTKKHFIAIANIVLSHKQYIKEQPFKALITDLCCYFNTENSLFNTERFKQACGYEKEEKNKITKSNVLA